MIIPVLLFNYSVSWASNFGLNCYNDALEMPIKQARMEICWGCYQTMVPVDRVFLYKYETTCVNPPFSSKSYQQRIVPYAGCYKPKQPCYFPPPICCYNPFSTCEQTESIECTVTTRAMAVCDTNTCNIDGYQKEYSDCLIRVGAERKTTSEICDVYSFGVFCPQSGSMITASDIIRSTNDSSAVVISSTNSLDQQMRSSINYTRGGLDTLSCMVFEILRSLSNLTVLNTDKIRGLDVIDGQYALGNAKKYMCNVTSKDGYWMCENYFVNPYTKELYRDSSKTWLDVPIVSLDRIYYHDGTWDGYSSAIYDNSLLRATGLATQLITKLSDEIVNTVPGVPNNTVINMMNSVSKQQGADIGKALADIGSLKSAWTWILITGIIMALMIVCPLLFKVVKAYGSALGSVGM